MPFKRSLNPRLLLPFGIVNLFLFLDSYRHWQLVPESLPIPLWSVAAAVFAALMVRKDLKKQSLPIVLITIANVFVSGALLFSTMFLPGSLEHNHVMYEVCMPAMRKHYGLAENETLPNEPRANSDMGKWWYQHLECEQNVWAGKGPVFSENPPGFEPLLLNQETQVLSVDLTYNAQKYTQEVYEPQRSDELSEIRLLRTADRALVLRIIDLTKAKDYSPEAPLTNFVSIHGAPTQSILPDVTVLGKKYSFSAHHFGEGFPLDDSRDCIQASGVVDNHIKLDAGVAVLITNRYKKTTCAGQETENTQTLSDAEIAELLEIISTLQF